jgi:uncharacterized protein (DUF1330 family)
MPAYLIANVRVHDPERYRDYAALAGASVAAHGGRYLARGGETDELEGDWGPERVVVLEFPSLQAARAWYASPAYAEAKAIRQAAATGDFVFVDGV